MIMHRHMLMCIRTYFRDLICSRGISPRIGDSPPRPMGSPRLAFDPSATRDVLAYPSTNRLRSSQDNVSSDSQRRSTLVHIKGVEACCRLDAAYKATCDGTKL